MDTLLFCFANDRDPTRHLPMLQKEDEGINQLLTPRSGKQYIQFLRDSYATTESVADNLWEYQKTLALFHFSGHAGQNVLQLEDKIGNGESIATLLGHCPNLKLVSLNGCSTRRHIELLSAAGVKAVVIATSTPVSDRIAKDFSINFYRRLALQDSLHKAMEAVRLTFPVKEAGLRIDEIQRGSLETADEIGRKQWYFFYPDAQIAQWEPGVSDKIKQKYGVYTSFWESVVANTKAWFTDLFRP